MNDEQLLDRIMFDREVMGGKPVIRGTRLTVEFVLNLLAHGSTAEEIIKEYEGLTPEDIWACLLFAARLLEKSRLHSVLELQGLGAEIWRGVRAQEYVDRERAAWDE